MQRGLVGRMHKAPGRTNSTPLGVCIAKSTKINRAVDLTAECKVVPFLNNRKTCWHSFFCSYSDFSCFCCS